MQFVLPDYPLHTRIAPTPSGFLHLGNGLSFVLAWLLARATNGSIRLRIDDMDYARVRPEYLEDIFVQLEFLGLDYDNNLVFSDIEYTNSQADRLLSNCREILYNLEKNNLLYACNYSRSGISKANQSKYNLRIHTKNQAEISIYDFIKQEFVCQNINDIMPDFVIWTKQDLPAYQLASLADDLHSNTNLIIRGQDLWPSSFAQAYLARSAGMSKFATMNFWHHPLLFDTNTKTKLSKSAGAYSIKEWARQAGKPKQIYACIADYLGFEYRLDYKLSDLLELLTKNKTMNIKEQWRLF